MKLYDLLSNPLTMAKFLNVSDLAKKALAERKLAADAIQCVDAHALCLESELEILSSDPALAGKLDTLKGIVADLKAATTVEANELAKAA